MAKESVLDTDGVYKGSFVKPGTATAMGVATTLYAAATIIGGFCGWRSFILGLAFLGPLCLACTAISALALMKGKKAGPWKMSLLWTLGGDALAALVFVFVRFMW